jgi:ubiquinone/menaquinone biosynthesis C-methylase UbiE
MQSTDIKEKVRENYGQIARDKCCPTPSSCCGDNPPVLTNYFDIKDQVLPESDLGLGCGLPTIHAEIKKGETVLDLGSGAGIDAFISAKAVGPAGKVIGVDFSQDMIKRAKKNAKKNNFKNVDFRYGELENLPVDDNTIDVILSNCVINLVPDKGKVFSEIYRVLKPGGRFTISDIVSFGTVPDEIREKVELWVGCIAGAVEEKNYLKIIEDKRLKNIQVVEKKEISYLKSNDFGFASITVTGRK